MANKKTGDNSSFEKVNGNYVSDVVDQGISDSQATKGYQEVKKLVKQRQEAYASVQKKIGQLRREIDQLNKAGDAAGAKDKAIEAAMFTSSPEVQNIQDQYEASRGALQQYEANIRESAVGQAQRRIRSQYNERSVASRQASIRGSSENYMAMREMSSNATQYLESQRDDVRDRQQRLQGMLSTAIDEGNTGRAQTIQKRLGMLESQEAKISGALGIQRKEGRDIVSQREDYLDKSERQQRKLTEIKAIDSEEIQNYRDSLSGKSQGSEMEKLQKEYTEALEASTKANRAFALATTNSAEELDELKKAADAANDKLASSERRMGEADDFFGQRNSRRGKTMRAIGMGLQIAGQAANEIGAAYEFFGVTHPAEEDSRKAQFAKIYSRQYSDLESAATRGDVKAQRRFFESYAQATAAGAEGFDAAQNSTIYKAAGGLMGIAGGLATTGGALTATGVLSPAGGLALAGAGLIAGVGYGARKLSEYTSGTPGASGYLTRFGARMELSDSEREIIEREEQAGMNNMRFMNQATVGMGGAADALFGATVTDSEQMKAFGNAGMNMARRNAMMQAGRMALGRDMTAADLSMGQSMEMAGYLSSAETIGALGELRDVGGSTGDLGNILKQAVAAGMDDAKSISALVSGISGMASNLAQTRGLSTTDAAQSMMGNLLQSTDASLPASLRSTMAMNAANFINQTSQDKSFSLENIVELGEVKKTLGESGVTGFTSRELNAVQSMDFKDISSLANMDAGEAKDQLRKMGLSRMAQISDDKLPGVLENLQRSSAKQMMFSAMGFVQNSGEQINKITKWAQAGGDPKMLGKGDFKDLSQEDVDQARLAFAERGINFETFTGALSGKPTDLSKVQTQINLQDKYLELAKSINTGEGRGVLTSEAKQQKLKEMDAIAGKLGKTGLARVQQMVSEGKFEFEQAGRGATGAIVKQAAMFEKSEDYDKMIKAMVEGQQKAAESLENMPEAASKLSNAGDKLSKAGDNLNKAIDRLLSGSSGNNTNFDFFGNPNKNIISPLRPGNGTDDQDKK